MNTVSHGEANHDPFKYSDEELEYLYGYSKPNYPVPAKRMRSFEYWRNLGEVSALNAFDIEVVQRLNRYR